MSSNIELSLSEEEVSLTEDSSEEESQEESQEVSQELSQELSKGESQELSKGDAKRKSVIIPKDIKYNNKPLCNRFSFRFCMKTIFK